MRHCSIYVLGVFLLLRSLSPPVWAEVDAARLLQVVEHWLELQEALQRERTEWHAQRDSMQHGIELLQREQELLRSRIAGAEADMDELAAADLAEAQLRSALQQTLADVESRIPVQSRERASEALRLELEQAIRNQNEHHAIHLERNVMTGPDQQQRQMQVLRLGHAQAYAVSPDTLHAAHGVWDGELWHWEWNAAWAENIRTAIRIAAGELAPRWVPLPVTLIDREAP